MTRAREALRLLVLATIVGGLAGCGSNMGGGGPKLERPYLEVRKSHATVLTTKGPAPQKTGKEATPQGAERIVYDSGDLKLWGWYAVPPGPADAKVPAVVYFHGGFALGRSDFTDTQPFLAAGYAVLLPSLRGENGNPGSFELLYGEVDDGRAAVHWLAQQPRIDPERIYAFGHSVGGGLSALLSLCDDIPVKATGSSGGLYPYTIFGEWGAMVPFDRRNPRERQLRLLLGNVAEMKRPHLAYLGDQDDLRGVIPAARKEAEESKAPLTVREVRGDHFTSLPNAVTAFIADIQKK